MEPLKENLSVMIIGILSRNLPVNIRRANYEAVIRSPAAGLLPAAVATPLVKLERAGVLFAEDRCPFPSFATPEVRTDFAIWHQEEGPSRRDVLAALRDLETYVLEMRVMGGAPEVRPPTVDEPALSEFMAFCVSKPSGISICIPDLEEDLGRIAPGTHAIIGGYAGCYKSVHLEGVVAEALEDPDVSALWISDARCGEEIVFRLLQSKGHKLGEDPRPTSEEIRECLGGLRVIGSNWFGTERSTRKLRLGIENWLSQEGKHFVLALDSLEGIAEMAYDRCRKPADAIASLLGLIEHLIDRSGKPVSVLATHRFTERTYSALKRRTDDHMWRGKQAGFGFLDLLNGIMVSKLEAESLHELVENWNDERDKPPHERSEKYKELVRQYEVQNKLMHSLESRLKEGAVEFQEHLPKSPNGRYNIGAFQDPPEIERFFHVCISFWLDQCIEPEHPGWANKGLVLACLLKAKGERTIEEPFKILFSGRSPKIIKSNLPTLTQVAESIDALIGVE